MKKSIKGFTIVELLIVIVVIGILATVTLVAFNGISQKATVSSIQSDLENNSKLLKNYYTEYGSYPIDVLTDANKCPTNPNTDSRYCLKLSSNNSIDYYNGTASGFVLRIKSGSVTYSVTNTSSPVEYLGFTVTGGTVSYVDSNGLNPRTSGPYAGGYTIRTFTSSGTLDVTESGTGTVLIVGGGGGGGGWNGYAGGGGGGGQFLLLNNVTLSGSINVVVGSGGSKGTASQGSDGQSSSFGSNVAIGGGGGGGGTTMSNGRDGASGGGAAGWNNIGGTGTAGFNGGNNIEINSWAAGGGGCGAKGSDAGSWPVLIGNGGSGKSSSISGNTVWYCGGGGGGAGGTAGSGGSGGGGNGGSVGVSGVANTGGGGGGGSSAGGNGGSGIVIVKYSN